MEKVEFLFNFILIGLKVVICKTLLFNIGNFESHWKKLNGSLMLTAAYGYQIHQNPSWIYEAQTHWITAAADSLVF